jgi:hypothetical protein
LKSAGFHIVWFCWIRALHGWEMSTRVAGEGTAWTGGSERQKDISHWCGAMAEMAEVLIHI